MSTSAVKLNRDLWQFKLDVTVYQGACHLMGPIMYLHSILQSLPSQLMHHMAVGQRMPSLYNLHSALYSGFSLKATAFLHV